MFVLNKQSTPITMHTQVQHVNERAVEIMGIMDHAAFFIRAKFPIRPSAPCCKVNTTRATAYYDTSSPPFVFISTSDTWTYFAQNIVSSLASLKNLNASVIQGLFRNELRC